MVYLLSSLLNSIQMLLYMFFMNAFFVRRHNSRLFWGYWLLWALIATVATNVFPSSIQLNGPFVFLMEIVILYGMNVTPLLWSLGSSFVYCRHIVCRYIFH